MQVRRVYKPLDLRKKHGKNERGLRNFTQISTGTMNYIGLDNSRMQMTQRDLWRFVASSHPRIMRSTDGALFVG